MSNLMTNEEAISYLMNFNISFSRGNGKTRLLLALKKAIEALEKQIPKKPEPDYYSGKYLCPVCHNEESYSIDGFGNYCNNCGQAIDKSLERSDEE